MKLYIINLATFGFYDTKKIDLSIVELIKLQNIIKDTNNHILLHAVMEYWDPQMINAAITMLGIEYDQPNVRLLVEEALKPRNSINFKNIFYYNDNLMKHVVANNDSNEIIDLNTNKFLYIVGKSHKRHRISLLYKLYKSGLLKFAKWSFRIDHPELTRDCINDIDDSEYQSFIENTIQDLDIDKNDPIFKPDNNGMLSHPVDIDLYKNTSFSLISETHCSTKFTSFITEKTWRAILNNHIFVIPSYVTNLELLEDIGIDTFQYALKHKKEEFTLDKTVDEIVDMTVENVRYLLQSIGVYEERLIASIKQNKIMLLKRIEHFRNIIDPSIEPYILKPYFYKKETIDLIEGSDAEKAIKKLWC